MIQSKADGIITAVKQYFKIEWPETVEVNRTSATTSSSVELPKFNLPIFLLHAGKQYRTKGSRILLQRQYLCSLSPSAGWHLYL